MMDRLRPRLSQSYSWMEVAKETTRNVLEGQDKKKKRKPYYLLLFISFMYLTFLFCKMHIVRILSDED